MSYNTKPVAFAPFHKRAAAYFIDTLALMAISFVVGFIVGLFLYAATGPGDPGGAGFVVGGLVGWLYFALFESSRHMATPGKMALGLKTTDANQSRLTFGRATGRHFARILSTLSIIGYFLPLITEKRQSLHDLVASTTVIEKP